VSTPCSLQGSQATSQAACLNTWGLFWLLLQVQQIPEHQSLATADGEAEMTVAVGPHMGDRAAGADISFSGSSCHRFELIKL